MLIYNLLQMAKMIGILMLLVAVCSCANWAVLVAGSNTWYNYRHQADVFHAYQVLTKKGFDPSRIIVFAYDDIAYDSKNPFPGKVFNKPTYANAGVDVYAGVRIDYWSDDVTPKNFMSVLVGDKNAVLNIGTGRVLQSTTNDNVFLFFSDHGFPGGIAFPNEFLFADQLIATFKKMTKLYSKLVFYLEACESGSMFEKLPKNTKIYALSASNPTESSYATYCSPDDVIKGKHIGTCLGDLFSVSFIEDSEENDLTKESLQAQFEKVKSLTTQSQVMQWGDTSFLTDSVDSFIGKGNNGVSSMNLRMPLKRLTKKQLTSFDSRYVKIKILTEVHKREQTLESEQEMIHEMKAMQKLDDIFFELAQKLKLKGEYSPENINFDCMRAVMNNHTEQCGRLSDYGLIFAKYYAEACEKYPAQVIVDHVRC